MNTLRNILCVIEPTDDSLSALKQSLSLAQAHQARLSIASCVNISNIIIPLTGDRKLTNKLCDDYIASKRRALDRFVVKHANGFDCQVQLIEGIPFIEITRSVIAKDYDLLVKSAAPTSWSNRVFGSEDMHLLRKCPCPVLIIKSDYNGPFRKILATVDLSDSDNDLEDESRVQLQLNQQVLQLSSMLALADSSELHIGCAWEAYGEEFYRYGAFAQLSEEEVDSYVDDARRTVKQNLELAIHDLNAVIGPEASGFLDLVTHMQKGSPEQEIPAMVAKYDIDLIVMGTVARTGIPGLLMGNTAESILQQVDCSVLAIKPEGFISPIKL